MVLSPKVTPFITEEEIVIDDKALDIIKMRKILKTYEELNKQYDLRIKNILINRK